MPSATWNLYKHLRKFNAGKGMEREEREKMGHDRRKRGRDAKLNLSKDP